MFDAVWAVIDVYSENRRKHINTKRRVVVVHADGARLSLTAAINEPIVHPQMIMSMERQGVILWTGKLPIRPPELSGKYPQSHPVAKQEEQGEGNAEFCLRIISFILFNIPSIFDMGPTALLSLQRKSCYEFLSSLKISSSSAGSEPANLGSNSKHASH
jgi:hypothetical protein